MNDFIAIYIEAKPWIMFLVFIFVCLKLINWARQRKGVAMALGIFVQMFIPDPKAQITIEAIAERKQEVKKQQDENGDPLVPNDEIEQGRENDKN